MTAKYDAIMVGGGLAGSGLAYALASEGRSVLVLEPDLLPDAFQSGPQHVTLDPERRVEIFGE